MWRSTLRLISWLLLIPLGSQTVRASPSSNCLVCGSA